MSDIKNPLTSGYIDSDAALTSDNPQAQVASQGWGQLGRSRPVQNAISSAKNFTPPNLGAIDQGALTSDDPQSQVAAQGFNQIMQTRPMQQAMDFSGNLERYDDMLNNAILGDQDAMKRLHEHSLGMAMGTVRGPEPKAPIAAAEEVLPTSVPMYSKLHRTVEQKMGGSATPEQVKGMLREIKGDEAKHYGIDKFLEGKTKVSKDELLNHINDNHLQIKDVVKQHPDMDMDAWRAAGNDGMRTSNSDAKFSQYTLPGGENYKETLYTLPNASRSRLKELIDKSNSGIKLTKDENADIIKLQAADKTEYKSSHYDEPNILAHTRTNERIGPDGKKHLFIEEIQSDWHQEGRKKGYKTEPLPATETPPLPEGYKLEDKGASIGYNSPARYRLADAEGEKVLSASSPEEAAQKFHGIQKASDPRVPDAPFKNTWHEYALKRLIKDAVEQGHDHISWTTGEQQAARYDLSKHIKGIKHHELANGKYFVDGVDHSGNSISIPDAHNGLTKEEIEKVLGKEVAEKIVAGKGKMVDPTVDQRELSGVDLKVGGEGMKGFYDKMVPDFMNKFGKKYGTKVEQVELAPHEADIMNGEDAADITGGHKVHTMKITPEMRKAILKEGLPTFRSGGVVGSPDGYDDSISLSAAAPLQAAQPIQSLDSPEVAQFVSQPSAGSLDSPEVSNFLHEEIQQAKYGTPSQQLIAGAEGLAQGIAGPLAPMAERAMGVNPANIRGRAQANPLTHFGFEIGGLLAPTGQGKALMKAGELAGKAFGAARATTLAGRVGPGAAKAAVENMLLAGSDETSRMILQDPKASSEAAIATVGLSGLLGGVLGGTLSAVSPLWNAAVGHKAGKVIEDFKGRIAEHINNPEPVAAMTEELKNYHTNVRSMADEVYGPQGLKAQDVAKALPVQVTPQIVEQTRDVARNVQNIVGDMKANEGLYPKRLTAKLDADLQSFSKRAMTQDVTEIFNATQDLKQTLQGYAKFDKFVKPVDEAYDFVNKAKELAHDLREKLEDHTVWGNAAKRQQAINKAFKEYLPTLKDFEKKFTVELAGEKVIDPGKIQTYMNQIGKPNAEIKQSMLKNFLDASDKYQKVIHDTHLNLGMESPVQHSSLVTTLSTLKEKSAGARLADIFIKKGLTDVGGKAIGAGVGGTLAHAVGANAAIGALVGEHALGPFFTSVLPALAKPLLSQANNAQGFKAAVDLSLAAAKGESLMTKAAKNVFREGSEILSQSLMPSDKTRLKLNKLLEQLKVDPAPMLSADNKSGFYMPDHSQHMNESAMNAVNYLNSLRTDNDKKAPLDPKRPLSSEQKAKFNNALNIADQPLIVMDKIKKGTITSQDVMTLNTLYPHLYNRLKSKLMDQIATSQKKGEMIPYKIRTSLSLFMGQPLDSTMTPGSILSIQSASQTVKQQSAPPSPAPKSLNSLNKLPGMYRTPSQQSEDHRSQK